MDGFFKRFAVGAVVLGITTGLGCSVSTSSGSGSGTLSVSCGGPSRSSCSTYSNLTSDQASSLTDSCTNGTNGITQGTVVPSCPTTGIVGCCAFVSTGSLSINQCFNCDSGATADTCNSLTSAGATNPVWTPSAGGCGGSNDAGSAGD